jgi:hypothetical protein
MKDDPPLRVCASPCLPRLPVGSLSFKLSFDPRRGRLPKSNGGGDMKTKRVFNGKKAVADAREGMLRGKDLRKTIKLAEELGQATIVNELRLFLVEAGSFAGDNAPTEVRERVAQGISALSGLGEPLSRTKQMLKKHGVIETLNRIAKYPAATKNFDKLCAAGMERLTAEAIVLDFPDLFDQKALAVARKRLGR